MFTASRLKEMLKQRAVDGFGRKDDLADRLIQVDPEGMAQHAADQLSFECSEKGQTIVQQYLTQEKTRARSIKQQTLNAIQQREFELASNLVASFEASQVFPRGINIDWTNRNPKPDVVVLTAIFASSPKILISLNQNQLNHLRVGAAMIHLWGTRDANDWLPQDFRTDLIMDNNAAARMIVFYVIHQAQIEQYRRLAQEGCLRVKYIEISATRDDCSCKECERLATRRYQLDNVPEIPHQKCTSELGCRCELLPRFD
jgi:hypothetical protein